MYSTVDDYLADKDPAAVDAFRKFRTLVLALGDDVEETVHTSEISWARASSSTRECSQQHSCTPPASKWPWTSPGASTTRPCVRRTPRRQGHHSSLESLVGRDLDDGFCALLAEAYNTASITAG